MKIKWDQIGERLYETGTDHGVLYVVSDTGTYTKGVAWNGLTGVNEAPTGAEPNPQWADNIKYLELMSIEEFAGTITAFTYPKDFEACNGVVELLPGVTVAQQERKGFGFTYRTVLGNDIKKNDFGYKLHLVYGALVSPSEAAYETINDSPEAIVFSWDFTTTPVAVSVAMEGKIFKPTAKVVLDSTKIDAAKLKTIEEILYGKDAIPAEGETPAVPAVVARLPLPDELYTLLSDAG